MSENENLSLWDRVKTTDPRFTKRVNQRGGFTSIDPQYQIREATAEWGPYGKAWKLEPDDGFPCEVILPGAGVILVKWRGRLIYPNGEFHITNAETLVGLTKEGKPRVDRDAYKKVETDTLTKALSKVGFNADVFLGGFDDQRYVRSLWDGIQAERTAKQAPQAEPKPATASRTAVTAEDKAAIQAMEGLQAQLLKLQEEAGLDGKDDLASTIGGLYERAGEDTQKLEDAIAWAQRRLEPTTEEVVEDLQEARQDTGKDQRPLTPEEEAAVEADVMGAPAPEAPPDRETKARPPLRRK